MTNLPRSRRSYKGQLLPTVDEIDAELARRHLLDYARFVAPGYETPPHICELAEHLEAVERGELKRLMVFMPPRHGKSRQVSQIFPCWYLGKHPTHEVIQAGYSAEISLEHSRKARDLFAGERNRLVFPEATHRPGRVSQDTVPVERQAAHEWGTVQKGRYRAIGVCGGITGFGGDLISIDDPVKNREEADSPTVSARVWDWYTSTLYTRLSPDGAIVITMTRWAGNDLAGRLLDRSRDEHGDRWVVIRMPAIDDAGQALWPSRWPLEKLLKIRSEIGQHEWSALYMQEPVVRGGNMLRAERIAIHDNPGDFPNARCVRFWDLASTRKERAKDDPDYTVGALCALTYKDGVPHFWVKHAEILQAEAPERNARMVAVAEADGPAVQVLVESVAGYKDAYTTIRDILRGRRTVKRVDVSTDKVVRAAGIEPIIEAGNFHILRGEWNRVFLDQLTAFPSGAHDDCVDAVSGAYNELSKPQPMFLDRKAIGI